jgi:type III secretion protein L
MSATLARPLGRVLRAAEAGLYAEAADAIALAHAEAGRIREDAARDGAASAAQLMETARVQAEAERTRILAEAALAVRGEIAQARLAVAEAIAEGVVKVIGGLDCAEAIARAALHAVAELQDRGQISVRVPPERAEGVQQALRAAGLAVVADAALAGDECVVETAAGFVRAGISEQVAALRAALLGAAS